MDSGAQCEVLLCCYNGRRYLPQQLDSILGQTLAPLRILIADDVSDDGTVEYLERRMGDAPRPIDLVRNPGNMGPAKNFESALRLARHPIVFLCDQDDLWDPGKLESAARCFAADPSMMVLQHDARVIDDRGNVTAPSVYAMLGVSPRTCRDPFPSLLRRNVAPGCTLAIRRVFLDTALPIPQGFMHDEWICLLAGALGVMRLIPDVLMSYRLHDDNTLGLRKMGRRVAIQQALGDVKQRRAEKLQRFTALQERLAGVVGLPHAAAQMDLLAQAIDYLRHRQALPASIRSRVRAVGRFFLAGAYHRHGSGSVSALRDLLGL